MNDAFFCFIPPSLEVKYEFLYIKNGPFTTTSEQPRELYFCEYYIMHFLQGFSEIFVQQWSDYVYQTALGAVCK